MSSSDAILNGRLAGIDVSWRDRTWIGDRIDSGGAFTGSAIPYNFGTGITLGGQMGRIKCVVDPVVRL
ncbi:MAG: hypothetical protein AAFP90_15745 [Planctomycetota bacterium]